MKSALFCLLVLFAFQVLAQGKQNIAIKFLEMYGERSIRGLSFSETLLAAENQKVEMLGYMAPPLKAELDFFVLTRVPLAVCPFCDTAASWPVDIVLVKMPKGEMAVSTISPLKVTGTLELGPELDEETGFVSLVRIAAEHIEPIKP